MSLVLDPLDFPSLTPDRRTKRSYRSVKKINYEDDLAVQKQERVIELLARPSLSLTVLSNHVAFSPRMGLEVPGNECGPYRPLPVPAHRNDIKAGRMGWAKVSIGKFMELHGTARYGEPFDRGNSHQHNAYRGSLLIDRPRPSATSRWKTPRASREDPTDADLEFLSLERLLLADMTGNPTYCKAERPVVVLKSNVPEPGYHLVLVLTTLDGYGLDGGDKFLRSVAYPIKGSAAAHVWLDMQKGKPVPITNAPVEIPLLRQYVHDMDCGQYVLALAMILPTSSIVNVDRDVRLSVAQVRDLTGRMLRHTPLVKSDLERLMLTN